MSKDFENGFCLSNCFEKVVTTCQSIRRICGSNWQQTISKDKVDLARDNILSPDEPLTGILDK